MKKIFMGILVIIFLSIGAMANAQSAADRRQATALIDGGNEDIRNNNYDAAIEKFTEAIRLNPRDHLAFYYRAGAYSNKGNYDNAIADYTEAIRLNSRYANAYNGRAWVYAYYLKTNFDQAISDANQALSLSRNNASYLDTRGWAYLGNGEYDKAIADFEAALRIRPDLQKSKEGLASAQAALLEEAFKQAPNYSVTNAASWIEAVNGIRSGGNNKVYVITVTGNVSIPASDNNTFGSVTGISVKIEGGGTLTSTGTGSLLWAGVNQTIILNNVTLRGTNNTTGVTVAGGVFRMEDRALITGHTRGVYVRGDGWPTTHIGIFDMQSGTISGNSGEGVHVTGSGTFNMSGGTISGNNGRGVKVESIFNMSNGTISGNRGGGVHMSGTFNMSGGTITGNNVNGNGGGVELNLDGIFNLIDGTISRNTASGNGGGVYMFELSNYGNYFSMQGGTITGNTAGGNGGGLCISYRIRRDIIISGGTISGNTANGSGGGISINIDISNRVNMSGGTISGNTAGTNGGGVHISSGHFNKTGGIIHGNDAAQNLRNIIRGGRGTALFDQSSNRWRNATAGESMNSDSYGFWVND